MYASKNGPPKASRLFLFFLARSECRLPTRCSSLLARCRCYRFDLFFSRLFRFSIPFLLAFSHAILHELMVKLPRLSAPIDLVSSTATPVTLRRSASPALPLRRFRKPIHLGPSDEALLPVSMLVLYSLKAVQRRRSKILFARCQRGSDAAQSTI